LGLGMLSYASQMVGLLLVRIADVATFGDQAHKMYV
jgi:hypothetical protein